MRPGDQWVGAVQSNEPVSVTILLKRPAALSEELLSGRYHPGSPDAAAQSRAGDPRDFAAVRGFAKDYGLTVRSEDPASNRVVLEGTVAQMDNAFGIEIGQLRDAAGHEFRSYRGSIQLPPALEGSVTAVLGLDQRPVARRAGE